LKRYSLYCNAYLNFIRIYWRGRRENRGGVEICMIRDSIATYYSLTREEADCSEG
jgi:hypothetical protein